MHAVIQKPPMRSSRHHPSVRQRVPRDVRAIGQHNDATGTPILQKSTCPCGGTCPKCQEDIVIQAKLKIGKPNNKYEQESERVAGQLPWWHAH